MNNQPRYVFTIPHEFIISGSWFYVMAFWGGFDPSESEFLEDILIRRAFNRNVIRAAASKEVLTAFLEAKGGASPKHPAWAI